MSELDEGYNIVGLSQVRNKASFIEKGYKAFDVQYDNQAYQLIPQATCLKWNYYSEF